MKQFGVFALIFVGCNLYSQNYWTWVHGSSNVFNVSPVYGTLTVGASSNTPGGRLNSLSWTDGNNNLWLYGGTMPNFLPPPVKSDLWKFNITTNQWTWMNGPTTSNNPPVYGTLGVPSVTNSPGAREGSCTWTDSNNDFWLFGGGYFNGGNPVYYCDLWKYTVATNQWMWVGGTTSVNASPVYGAQNISSPLNTPGGRAFSAGSVDANGNFLLYGGECITNTGSKGDLWKYNTTTNEWVWISGSTAWNAGAVYGTIGIGTASNYPGTRKNSIAYVDNAGQFWIYGGLSPGGFSGDMWKYNFSSADWTWMAGTNFLSSTGQYGTQGAPSFTNYPSGRYWSGSGHIKDNNGALWFMGGGAATNFGIHYNDSWRYIPSTGVWVWENGSSLPSQTGFYGTQNVPGPANVPGARYGQCSWKGVNGSMWIYGGHGRNYYTTSQNNASGHLNDLWRLDICQTPTVSSVASVGNLSICNANSTTLTALSGTAITNWYLSPLSPVTVATGTSYATGVLYAVGASSVYTFYVGTNGSCAMNYNMQPVTVTVNPTPVVSVNSGSVCAGNSFTISVSGANSYTFSGGGFVVTPTVSTSYSVTGTNTSGCISLPAVSTITVYTLPNITLTGSTGIICTGETVTLTAGGANSYTWNTGFMTPAIVISPTISTNYTVTGTGLNNCTGSATLTQLVSDCTGLDEPGKINNYCLIYPNPNNGVITIDLFFPGEQIFAEVYNSLGQLILKQKIGGLTNYIIYDKESPGMYLLKILDNSKLVYSGKLVNNK